jgi:hypothetical protein
MRAEHLHAKLMLEAARDEDRLWYRARLELVKAVQPESKSDQCRRQLRDLRAKTNAIECELDLRHRVELESQRHLKTTMALREANNDASRETGESGGDKTFPNRPKPNHLARATSKLA